MAMQLLRGVFSVNNALVTQEKGSLAERSIVALRVVKEAICLVSRDPDHSHFMGFFVI